jgi:hypothetical protein
LHLVLIYTDNFISPWARIVQTKFLFLGVSHGPPAFCGESYPERQIKSRGSLAQSPDILFDKTPGLC